MTDVFLSTMSKKGITSYFLPNLLTSAQLAEKSHLNRQRKQQQKPPQKQKQLKDNGSAEKPVATTRKITLVRPSFKRNEKQISLESDEEVFETQTGQSDMEVDCAIPLDSSSEDVWREHSEESRSVKRKRLTSTNPSQVVKMSNLFKSDRIIIKEKLLFCEACFKHVSCKKSTVKDHVGSDAHINGSNSISYSFLFFLFLFFLFFFLLLL